MIKIENLSKKWKDFEIKNLSMDIRNNEYLAILGPSGSGKTLLLELISGIYFPDHGKIIYGQEDITYQAIEKRNIMLVYQDYMLFPHKTVYENIAFGPRMRKLKDVEIKNRVHDIMELLKISHLSNRLPNTLSGGEKQRTAIARALILQPKVLLMDEPLSALDREIKDELIKELRIIHRKFDVTIVHVTHNFDEALTLADRIAIVKGGELIQVGTSEDVFQHPKSKFVAEFVGTKNILKGVAKSDDEMTIVDTGNIIIYSTEKKLDSCYLSIRPEDIFVFHERPKNVTMNIFNGHVKEMVDRGSLVELVVDVGEVIVVFMSRQFFLEMNISLGEKIWLHFKPELIHLFD